MMPGSPKEGCRLRLVELVQSPKLALVVLLADLACCEKDELRQHNGAVHIGGTDNGRRQLIPASERYAVALLRCPSCLAPNQAVKCPKRRASQRVD